MMHPLFFVLYLLVGGLIFSVCAVGYEIYRKKSGKTT